jgi:dTDP-3-amino-3,4,6-trideoxy-alpha-D-glucose transaminase
MTLVEARRVPLNALAPGVEAIRAELDAAIGRVLASGRFLLGEETSAFEREFAAYHGPTLRGVGVGSGTDALRIGLQALGVGEGDEVLVPANAGVPPVAAVVAAGARPVFGDVDPATDGLDPAEVGRRATPRTRAVLVVHLYGRAAAIRELAAEADRRGLRLLEDCAQAHGARTAGQPVGTFGDAAAFSFYPTKNMGALGDAGLVLSADPAVVARARLLREYGWRTRYLSELHSTVSRLDELQAAVLRAKLGHLAAWNRARRALAARYRTALGQVGGLVLPTEGADDYHVYHLFVVRSPRRDALRAFLAARGVGSGVHYPRPAHLQAPYARFGRGAGSLPCTEQLARQVLSLPLYPELAPDDVDYVADQVRAFHHAA